MHVVVFEDSRWHALAPFSLSRPVFTLVTGATSLLKKQIRHLRPTRLTLWVRPEFESHCRERVAPETGVPTAVNEPLDDAPALLVNGRSVHSLAAPIPGEHAAAIVRDEILAASTTDAGLGPADALAQTPRWQKLRELPNMPAIGKLADSPVDLIYWNDQSLVEDFASQREQNFAKIAGPYHLINELDISLGADVTLGPGCVLDASKGPITIAAGAAIGANAVLQGPCYIGHQAVVAPVAVIRHGTTVGPHCKVGGEVSASILLGYSNKGHEGFLGHSYLGKWVNLGAGTTTSNLKNTYGEITLKRGEREIATGKRFLGSLIGDHSKTAVLTRLMGGAYVGYFSMLAAAQGFPRFVPSFCFWTDKGPEPYDREKAVEVAQRVFTRRNRIWTEIDEQIMNYAARVAPQVET